MRRLWFPILLGVVGVAVLIGLGLWQLDRMAQKEALLARIEERIGAEPVELPHRRIRRRTSTCPSLSSARSGGRNCTC